VRIDSIEVFHVAMPLVSPWRTAYGEDAAIESVLVKLRSGDVTGWGESAPFAAPCYSAEWAGGAFCTIRDWLAPALIGGWFDSGEALQARLSQFKGNPFAKAALDTAWWVLEANRRGLALHKLLGGARDAVDVGADFSVMDSVGDLLRAIAGAVEAGFKRVKLKYRPGWDIAMVRAVRQEFPSQTFHIDCNSGYTMRHFEMFCQLDDFNLAMIEQPLSHDDLIDHARLQTAIRTPICLDESVSSVFRAEQALDLGSCRWMNVKPGRVGGLTNAVAIHNLCRDANVPCWVGGMLESAIGGRICAALATLDNFTYPADIFPSSRFYVRDLSRPAIELVHGRDGGPQIALTNESGIGTEPDPQMLETCCKSHSRIEA
jgi:O-succinylbenzoate synthase